MNVAILGYGAQGQSALEYWAKQGHAVTVCDKDESRELPEGIATQLGAGYLAGLDRFDLIVRSPSIHPRDIITANPGLDIQSRVTTNTNEFFKVCPTKNIIGVTGTKGKGTTSTLITKMLEAAGKRVHLGGNIGTPPLEMLKNDIRPDDWVVLELANFQLIDLKFSPPYAVCLMVEPEHQDWHADVQEYIAAKQQLFRWQSIKDTAVYYGLNPTSQHIASVSPGTKIPYMKHPGADVINNKVVIDGQVICDVNQIQLPGNHNWQNVCAAITIVWQAIPDQAAITKAIASTKSLPFRIELRKEVHGVKYYNDSFATAPGAAIAAIEAIPEPKILLIGGYERGLNLEQLASTIKNHEQDIRKVVVYGASGPRMAENLERAGFTNYSIESSQDFSTIFKIARDTATTGDSVVLSPGFASFDMFKNFEERGKAFNRLVEEL